MTKVSIKLKNCYGIRNMAYDFDFSKKSAYVVYASNGTMKTSFTKTLKDISLGKAPKEEVFERVSEYTVVNESHVSIKADEIFVIESYDANYYSKRMSALLMNRELQGKYNLATQEILDRKNQFIDVLKQLVGSKVAIEDEFIQAFQVTDFLEGLANLYESGTLDSESSVFNFSLINYSTLFDSKVESFIKDDANFRLLTEYGEQYDKLVANSTFLKKGVFSPHNATIVNNALSDNGFFNAGHKVLLQGDLSIISQEDFNQKIDEEKAKVLSEPRLLKRFNQIDKKLSANMSLRGFRVIIESYPELISKLVSYESFKKEAWIDILNQNYSDVSQLVGLYKKAQVEIGKIQLEAQKESEKWRKVVEIFTNRFSAPFTLQIGNQEDVVLKNSVPTLLFKYREHDGEKEIERSKLTAILSGGERRTLYLLNIIFELEALKEENKDILEQYHKM